jgi:hypothetical protein
LIEKSAEIDDAFFAELDQSLEANKYTFMESERMQLFYFYFCINDLRVATIKTLKEFCLQVKEATLAAEEKRTVIK